jgi:hypothetical protein
MDATTKTLASLLAPCAFALGSSVVADFEGGSQGVKWSNMHMSTDNYSFQTSILMMVFDFFLFTFLAWYLDKGEQRQLHWSFAPHLCSPSPRIHAF